jgi:hypothetical protein
MGKIQINTTRELQDWIEEYCKGSKVGGLVYDTGAVRIASHPALVSEGEVYMHYSKVPRSEVEISKDIPLNESLFRLVDSDEAHKIWEILGCG